MSSKLRAILFDLDGVLVDSRVPITRCLNHGLEANGLRPEPPESLYRYIGPPLADAYTVILQAQGAPQELVGACVAAYRERYRTASLEETELVPGMAAVVAGLAQRMPVAVATSKPTDFAIPILETLGLATHFRAVVGPCVEARSEPKSETVARALEALGDCGSRPAQVAMVGDRHHDVDAGRAHGLLTVGVAWGIGSEAELREAGADHFVTQPDDLTKLFA